MFRTESGQVHVLDAYCQHLGANMGVGGTVEGENIVCPWHGWRWRGDGTNALIPYSKIGCKNNVRIRTYPERGVVRLHSGLARAPRPGAVLAAARAARAGDRRVLPAAPAQPDAQPGQGARADDHRERRRPVSRAVRAQGRQPREHRVVRGHRLPPARHGQREFRWRPGKDLADTQRAGRRQDHLRQLLAGAGNRALPVAIWSPRSRSPVKRRSTRTTPTTSTPRRRFASPAMPATSRPAAPPSSWRCSRKSSNRTSSPGRT